MDADKVFTHDPELGFSSSDYQAGQVLMRNKCLEVIRKYYGSSVYDYLREKIMEISLEE